MSNNQRKFLGYLRYGGLSSQEFNFISDRIIDTNITFIERASLLAAFTFAVIFGLSFVQPVISGYRWIYFYTMLAMTLLWTLFMAFRKHKRTSMALCYVFLLILYCFGMILGLTRLDDTGTAFCVFVVVLPLLVVGKPYRTATMTWISSFIFCVISFITKPTQVATLELFNVVIFVLLSGYTNIAMVKARITNILNEKNAELERDTDFLTGVSTRKSTDFIISRFFESENCVASLIMIDIDNFKEINDTYGHDYGDDVLKLVGKCLQNSIRRSDTVCRFGGDEFMIFLPNAEKFIAKRKAAQIIENVALLSELERIKAPFTISIGGASCPADAQNYEDLFKAADLALYRAKSSGKNGFAIYNG